jgi:hypothetical protein
MVVDIRTHLVPKGLAGDGDALRRFRLALAPH